MRPTQPTCTGQANVSLIDCVGTIHADGLDSAPGQVFSYGPEHMQIAALVISQAAGRDFSALLEDQVTGMLGISATTNYESTAGANVRYSGGLNATALDYGALLAAVLKGDIFRNRTAFLEDRIANAQIGYRPPAGERAGRDWHYGLGFWIECDTAPFDPSCAQDPIISSAGAFGFVPWVDFREGYWAIIAMEERGLTNGLAQSAESVLLEQALQPLIITALAAAR